MATHYRRLLGGKPACGHPHAYFVDGDAKLTTCRACMRTEEYRQRSNVWHWRFMAVFQFDWNRKQREEIAILRSALTAQVP